VVLQLWLQCQFLVNESISEWICKKATSWPWFGLHKDKSPLRGFPHLQHSVLTHHMTIATKCCHKLEFHPNFINSIFWISIQTVTHITYTNKLHHELQEMYIQAKWQTCKLCLLLLHLIYPLSSCILFF
jgi:hypothetical protein